MPATKRRQCRLEGAQVHVIVWKGTNASREFCSFTSEEALLTKIALVVLAIVVVGVMVARSLIEAYERQKMASTIISNIDLLKVVEGTYTGSYDIFPVIAEVKVTVKDYKITAIQLVKHRTGQGQGAEALPGKVVAAQSLQVDTVTGATLSSKVILKAIENALRSGVK